MYALSYNCSLQAWRRSHLLWSLFSAFRHIEASSWQFGARRAPDNSFEINKCCDFDNFSNMWRTISLHDQLLTMKSLKNNWRRIGFLKTANKCILHPKTNPVQILNNSLRFHPTLSLWLILIPFIVIDNAIRNVTSERQIWEMRTTR